MRLTGLLALLLFILILLFAAPAASYAQTNANDSAATLSSKSDAALLSPDNLADMSRRLREGMQFERDGVCYTMRTYVMAREDRDSDVTRMVRATRCLPAWKLEFKSAVAPSHRNEDDARSKP